MRVLLIDDIGVPDIIHVIRSLKQGVKKKIFVVSIKEEGINSNRFSRYVNASYSIKQTSERELIEKLIQLALQLKVDVVLPVKVKTMKLFSEYHDTLTSSLSIPPHSDLTLLNTVEDKWLLNNWLKKNGFPTPTTIPADTVYMEKMRLPVLLKPKAGTGGKGIRLISKELELKDIMLSIKGKESSYVFQELIDGEDIDISLMARNGEMVSFTVQKGILKRKFAWSQGISFLKCENLQLLTEKIISTLGWSGIAHLDFIYNRAKDTYYLVDFNPRYWSSLPGSLSVGVNFPEIACSLALSQEVKFKGYKEQDFYMTKAGIKMIFGWLTGRNKRIELHHTTIPELLKDPLPEIAKAIQAMFKKKRNIG